MPTILHVSRVVELNGAQQSLLLLIEGLEQHGFESLVAVPRPGPLTRKLEELNVKIIYVPSMKPWLLAAEDSYFKRASYNLLQWPFLLNGSKALQRAIQQSAVDIVHTTTAEVFDGALAAKINGVPHIWHVRESIETYSPRRFFLGSKIARALIKHFSDRVVACSHQTASPFIASSTDKNKVNVVHNGLKISLFNDKVSVKEIRQKLNIPVDATVIGMVAQRAPHKRHEDFLNAATIVKQTIPNSFFIAVGSYQTFEPSGYEEYVLKLTKDLGLANQMLWLDFQDKISEIFMTMDLLVHPSADEPFGRVIIEAMAASKPVVATNVGGIPEIVVDGVTGLLVPPLSPKALASAIISILVDHDLAKSMGKAGRQRVEQNFTSEKYVDSIISIYRQIL